MSNWALASGDTFALGAATPAWGGAAHTKGAWVEVVASTPFAGCGLFVGVSDVAGQTSRYLVDIGIGAAGSEEVLIANLAITMVLYKPTWIAALLPIAVPKGSRLSVRHQLSRSTSSSLGNWRIALVPSNPLLPTGFQRAYTAGADTANTELTPVLQSYGADVWYEFIASTPFRVRAYCIMSTGSDNSNNGCNIKIGIGASGAEKTIGPIVDSTSFGGATRAGGPSLTSAIPCDIPVGTRISVCVKGSSATYTHMIGLLLFG